MTKKSRFAAWLQTIARSIALLVAITVWTSTPSQATSLNDSTQTTWRMNDGLPQDSVKQILQTRDGFIWVATQEGLARFDGIQFTCFNTRNTPELVSNNIHQLAEDRWGNLWIYANSSIVVYRDGEFHDVTPGGRSSTDRVTRIWVGMDGCLRVLCDHGIYIGRNGYLATLYHDAAENTWADSGCDGPDGSIWLVFSQGKLMRLQNGRYTTSPISAKMGAGSVSLCTDASHAIWITCPHGLFRFDGTNWKLIAGPEKFGNIVPERVRPSRDGRVWCIAAKRLYSIDKTGVHPHSPFGDGVEVNELDVDPSGNLWIKGWDPQSDWIGTPAGKGFERTRINANVVSEWVMAITRDHQGNIWVGTRDGLICCRALPYRIQSLAANTHPGQFGGVALNGNGGVYATQYDHGVFTVEPVGATPSRIPAFGKDSPNLMCPDGEGGLWYTTDNRHLLHYNGRVIQDRSAWLGNAFDPTDSITTFALTRSGDLLIGQHKRVVRLHGRRTEAYVFGKDATNLGSCDNCLVEDRHGRIWVGGLTGVACIDHGRIWQIGAEDGLPTVPVIAMVEGPSGDMWFGLWGGGLARWSNGKVSHISYQNGLSADSIHALLTDDWGNLWIGSTRGISYVSFASLRAFIDGKAAQVHCVSITEGDRVEVGAVNAGYQPVACKTPDGHMWFVTYAGIFCVDTRPLAMETIPVYIESVRANGQSLNPRHDAVVQPGRGEIELNYTALAYRHPQDLRFAYRLIGYNSNWVRADDRRTATFTNLPPGRYRFEVRAMDASGVWSPCVATLSITLRPYFYQTLIFRVLVGLLILAAFTSLVWARMLYLHRQNIELERRVAIRTQELEEANKQLVDAQGELAAQNASLQEMQSELEAQNDELQSTQAELEAQNEELYVARTSLETQNEELMHAREELAVKNAELHELATTDAMTGARNHRAFRDRLTQVWAEYQRYGGPLSLILIDVDRFKQFNDTFGHPAGDEVLRQVSRLLGTECRSTDFLARYGGEEFVVILPHTDSTAALAIGERMRTVVAGGDWPHREVTASFGVATAEPGYAQASDLISAADRALYSSKANGRNLVTHIDAITPQVQEAA